MSELPEDSKDWPRDPFMLLGIERNSDLKSAKRAYIKRIKKYKPDKFPAEFQKIHEAFETVQNWLSWQRQGFGDSDPSDEEGESLEAPPSESRSARTEPKSEHPETGDEPDLQSKSESQSDTSANTTGPATWPKGPAPATDPFEKFRFCFVERRSECGHSIAQIGWFSFQPSSSGAGEPHAVLSVG